MILFDGVYINTFQGENVNRKWILSDGVYIKKLYNGTRDARKKYRSCIWNKKRLYDGVHSSSLYNAIYYTTCSKYQISLRFLYNAIYYTTCSKYQISLRFLIKWNVNRHFLVVFITGGCLHICDNVACFDNTFLFFFSLQKKKIF